MSFCPFVPVPTNWCLHHGKAKCFLLLHQSHSSFIRSISTLRKKDIKLKIVTFMLIIINFNLKQMNLMIYIQLSIQQCQSSTIINWFFSVNKKQIKPNTMMLWCPTSNNDPWAGMRSESFDLMTRGLTIRPQFSTM